MAATPLSPAVDGAASAQGCVPAPWVAGLMRSGQVVA